MSREMRDEIRRVMTLSDVRRSCGGAHSERIRDDSFFSEYGDYRVVEGVLRVDTRAHLRCPEVIIDADDQWHYPLGESGDRVKLLLPPDEKVQSLDGARERILEAQLEATRGREFDERDRADKYEKALREIGEHPAISSYMALRDIAREALDDE